MKKIALVSNTTSSLLNFRKHLIHFLIERKYKVYCLSTDYTQTTKKIIEDWGAIPIDYKLSRAGLNPFADIKTIRNLEKIFGEIQPDIVLSNFVKPVIYGSIAAYRAKVPRIIAMIEGLGYAFTDQPEGMSLKQKIIQKIQIFLYKIALPKADVIIFLNNDDPKDLIQKYKIHTKKIEVLGGIGLDLNDFPKTPVPLNPISFLWIGRLLKEKGIWEFLKAAEIVKQKHPEVEFKIIGGLDEENPGGISRLDLEKFTQKNIVKYLGEVQNVAEVISSSSSSSSSSYREGSPRSIQEAMAVGRAIIATDIPGSREAVIDGVNGFLVPKWNPKALAEKMCVLIENPDLLVTMGEKSHQIAVEKYDGNKVNEKLVKILKG
ncbi:glycosyltransferase family 4 protein [Capnocytophaga catalasegens]|uniref:glycosyltransferase family 4 protein n=1 Tax=Capnocytophaga catalasegens TaxID=1004260 RepID=UPI00222E662E|nr:glycosyltransferase family 4 protein [Capnocytophaga catalasegens]GIZ15185.1 glycosyl transferase family 1 [Capnocytophaga catalasegens]